MRSSRALSHRRRTGDASSSHWLSFSDLMSSLLLIFILIMFYIMFNAQEMYEINMAEIARQQFDLDTGNASLDEQQTKLTEAESQMLAQQIKLNAAQAELNDAESILATQQAALDSAKALLDEKETEISTQQAELDALSVQLGMQQLQINQQQATLTEQATTLNTQALTLAAQQQTLEDQQQQIEALVGMKTRIIQSLSEALRAANISAQVDPSNGSIALQSEVLFALNRYDLTDNGKRFVDQFLKVYLDVLFSDEYREYVSEIIIEGHTDSTGGYIRNLALSQQRAYAVASYVLDDAYTGITADQKRLLREVVTANGRSYSDPVLDAFGREDEDASRRVVFKFRLTDEQMIQQLKAILEQQDIPEQEPEE